MGAYVGASAFNYWQETRRPVYSAALVLPFLLTYHIGTLVIGAAYINGADALLLRMLSTLSVQGMFASALVLGAVFIYWQVRTKASWRFELPLILTMFLESACYGILLFQFLHWLAPRLSHMAVNSGFTKTEQVVLFCGAGVYEELFFRVIVMGLLLLVFTKLMHFETAYAAGLAVLASSMLFSLFHYIGPGADVLFDARGNLIWNGFLQRFFAGVYFAAIFVLRNYGVAAAGHAFYDILTIVKV